MLEFIIFRSMYSCMSVRVINFNFETDKTNHFHFSLEIIQVLFSTLFPFPLFLPLAIKDAIFVCCRRCIVLKRIRRFNNNSVLFEVSAANL